MHIYIDTPFKSLVVFVYWESASPHHGESVLNSSQNEDLETLNCSLVFQRFFFVIIEGL